QGGLTAAVFTDNVEYREIGGVPPLQRIVTSRVLDTTLANGFNDIRVAHFSGNVRFRDSGMQATAASVQYQVPTGEVELTGKIGKLTYNGETSAMKLGGNATLWQGDTKIQGPVIQVDGSTGNLSASGGVRSWMVVQDTNAETKVEERSVARGVGQDMAYDDS